MVGPTVASCIQYTQSLLKVKDSLSVRIINVSKVGS